MSIPTAFAQTLTRALDAPVPFFALREAVKAELQSGAGHQAVASWLEQTRRRFPEQEDLILEVLDVLAGWCSPQVKL